MRLEVEGICFSYGDRRVLEDVSFSAEGGVLSILGPNGAGKSTLVKCLAGVHRPDAGTANFDGVDLLGARDPGSLRMSYMSQEQPASTTLTVLEVMLLGMFNTLSYRVSDEELDRAMAPLKELNLTGLSDRPLNQLSGGQCQMVMVAQCLVSDPQMMVLDEPMNNLDLRRELMMFDTMSRVTRERDLVTVMVLHDINFAARYSDRMMVLKDGQVYGIGTPEEMVTEEMLRDVYGVEAVVDRDRSGVPRVDPIRAIG